MKKLIMFFIGLCTLAVMFVMLAGAAAIYDTAGHISVSTYFFQPNRLSFQRVGVPATINDLGKDKIRRMLVEKYVYEYFYVIPDANNIKSRMEANSTLAKMSMPGVFSAWQSGEGAEIEKLVENNVYRTVRVVGDIYKPENSDYWTVMYEMKTWLHPNNMAKEPVVTCGTLYMGIDDANLPNFRPQIKNMATYLNNKDNDPATIFRFGITYIDAEKLNPCGNKKYE